MGRRDETTAGGPRASFPSTRWSLLLTAKDPTSPLHRRALNDLCLLYWKPIYAYLRAVREIGNEDAKDLTQEFLCELVEGGSLKRYARERGGFRTYLRGALRLFLRERHRHESALKRGGGRKLVPLEGDEARRIEGEVARSHASPEDAFDRQWRRSVLAHAVEDLMAELRASGKETYARVFDRYELNPPPGETPSYASVARELGLKETDVTNYLAHCRRRLRDLIALRVRDYVASDGDLVSEMARFF